jgi:four helix bundle protein
VSSEEKKEGYERFGRWGEKGEEMSQDGLEQFGGYVKALSLYDAVLDDMERLASERMCRKLVSQQVASADSIAANIEEGYGRLSTREYVQFLVYAKGSARETRGRYLRMRRWLEDRVLGNRMELLDEIIGILTATINTLGTKDK